MRPQDVVILLKIIALGDKKWFLKDLATQLNISNSEVSESLHRSVIGGLIESDKKTIKRKKLLEFLVYGVRHVFPAVEGRLARGMPTAFSASVLSEEFVVENPYIWPAKGFSTKGISIAPLYHTVPQACENDTLLYDLLALTDALRMGAKSDVLIKLLSQRMGIS
ncbi:hypothetical protein CK503_05860 [Aliifodinibius salipaludis]|uniref:Uncharacterized protein n=2 Tax=Fodinibius salipaludis TaxID=2032627 RepID=A0A2A2GDS3_9BACT|nr:hypothetical protein CK503_05860 [Aliifodinibius salipaludis]